MGSELKTIQEEILRRFQRPRTTAADIPGYAGGNLQGQLNREGAIPRSADVNAGRPRTVVPGAQSDQHDITWDGRPRLVGEQEPQRPSLLTSRNQEAITRPRYALPGKISDEDVGIAFDVARKANSATQGSRSIFAPPQEPQVAPTNQVEANTRARNVFAPPPYTNSEGVTDFRVPKQGEELQPVSMSRDRRAEPRDYVADDAQYLRDLETKPRKWTDKAVDVLRVANQAFGSNPNIFTPTKREREELKARGMLGQDIAIQKEQTARDMAQMVPIYDSEGKVIGTAPARIAAPTQVRATDTGRRAAETKRRNTAYIADIERKDSQGADKQLSLDWAKGLFDDDPDMLAYVGKKKGMTGPAPKSNQGQLAIDKDGNFTIVRKGSATADTVTDTTGNAVGSWNAAQFQAAEAGRDKRAKERNVQSERNATIVAGGKVAGLGDPGVHRKNIAEIDQDMNDVDTEMATITARTPQGYVMPAADATALNQLRQRKNALERERRDEREKLGKIESAQGNLKTRGGPTANQGSSSGSFNLGAWKTDHPNATPDQIQAQRAKAKARKLAIVE
jgi:hypothetical protein